MPCRWKLLAVAVIIANFDIPVRSQRWIDDFASASALEADVVSSRKDFLSASGFAMGASATSVLFSISVSLPIARASTSSSSPDLVALAPLVLDPAHLDAAFL